MWLPGRDKATQTPNLSYAYLLRDDAATAVTTSSLVLVAFSVGAPSLRLVDPRSFGLGADRP